MASDDLQSTTAHCFQDITMDDFIHIYRFFYGSLGHGRPDDPARWRLAASIARVLVDGMFSRSQWKPRPVEDIIAEVDKLFGQDGMR